MFTLDRVAGINDCRRLYKSDDGKLFVEICTCDSGDRSNKNSLMNLYVKNGWLSEWLPTYLSVSTYFYDDDGCHGYYNPTEKLELFEPGTPEYKNHGGARYVINFDWKLEATPENEKRILEEVERRYKNDIRIYKTRARS